MGSENLSRPPNHSLADEGSQHHLLVISTAVLTLSNIVFGFIFHQQGDTRDMAALQNASEVEKKMLSYQMKTALEIEKNLQDFLVASGDGYTAKQMFGERRNCYAYTFDDVIVMPGHMNFAAEHVSLETNITKKIRLKVPMLSSPMDTVTEHQMAIGMALQGAIGIIHYNMTVEEQSNEVRLVKKYKNGFITDPACLSPDNLISDVDKLKERFGYSGIPITTDGKLGSKLVGIVTNRDLDYVVDRTIPLKDVMTTALVTATEGVSLSEANEVLRSSKKGKLPVVNAAGEIVALISRTGKQSLLPKREKTKLKSGRTTAILSTFST